MLKNLVINRFLQNAACVIAVICLFSACSSVSGFQKRKYTRGHYFSSAHKPNKTETRTIAKKTQQASENEYNIAKTVETDSPETMNTAVPLKNPDLASKPASQPRTVSAKTSSTDRIETNKQPLKITYPELRKQVKAEIAKKGVLGTGMKIVLVILLIALALLVIFIISELNK